DEFDVLDTPERNQTGQALLPFLSQWMHKVEHVGLVFVIGRRPEELSIATNSALKGVTRIPVSSLLDRDTITEVTSQSQREGSLIWPNEAINRICYWTDGHPYFTQLLCREVWDRVYRTKTRSQVPTAKPTDIDSCIDEVLRQAFNAFKWIWDGLPSSTRFIMSVVAATEEPIISHEGLVRMLDQDGISMLGIQLDSARDTLAKLELLQQVNDSYRFTVRILLRWIELHRPVDEVKKEVKKREPVAERLFETGQIFYTLGDFRSAIDQLEKARDIDPNHWEARLLLGTIYQKENRLKDAISELERAYELESTAIHIPLLEALVNHASKVSGESEQLRIYQQILEVDPEHKLAQDSLNKIHERQRIRHLEERLQKAEQQEKLLNWSSAVQIYRNLLDEYSGDVRSFRIIQPRLERANSILLMPLSALSNSKLVDYLRLMWWIFVTPQSLKNYKVKFGAKKLVSIMNSLASMITWLPLVLFALSLVLKFLLSTEGFSKALYFPITLVSLLFISWWISDAILESSNYRAEPLLAVCAGIILAFGVSSGIVMMRGIGEPVNIVIVLATTTAIIPAVSIADISGKTARSVASGVTCGTAFGLTLGLSMNSMNHLTLFSSLASSMSESVLIGVLVSLLVGGIAFALVYEFPPIVRRCIFLLSIFGHTVLVLNILISSTQLLVFLGR
ncbi:tetratricopeptide repeat protein, partial [Nitrosomonas nitrosa]|uniref:tetratricopeptide repeat protein n=1 Tax=Nitrosomonas nitrosa TaxID=52442 RepID=UPI0023FA11C6